MELIKEKVEFNEKEEAKSDFELHGCFLHHCLVDKDYCTVGCQPKNAFVKSLVVLYSGKCPFAYTEEDYYEDLHESEEEIDI